PRAGTAGGRPAGEGLRCRSHFECSPHGTRHRSGAPSLSYASAKTHPDGPRSRTRPLKTVSLSGRAFHRTWENEGEGGRRPGDGLPYEKANLSFQFSS